MPAVPQTRVFAPVPVFELGQTVEITLKSASIMKDTRTGKRAGHTLRGVIVNDPISGQVMGVIRGNWCLVGYVRKLNSQFYEVLNFGRPRIRVSADAQLIKLQS